MISVQPGYVSYQTASHQSNRLVLPTYGSLINHYTLYGRVYTLKGL
jgi:hypothetical protein